MDKKITQQVEQPRTSDIPRLSEWRELSGYQKSENSQTDYFKNTRTGNDPEEEPYEDHKNVLAFSCMSSAFIQGHVECTALEKSLTSERIE